MAQSRWEQDVDFYLEKLEVVRLHITNSFLTLRTYRTDYRYVYKCQNPPSALPLYFLTRELQTNMSILDASGRDLVYLPHMASYEVAGQFLRSLWSKYRNEAQARSEIVAPDPPRVLLRVTEFESDRVDAVAALDWIRQATAGKPPYPWLEALALYIEVMTTSYIPLVETPSKGSSDFYFLRCGIDYYPHDKLDPDRRAGDHAGALTGAPTLWELCRFGLTGGFEIEQFVPIECIRFPPWRRTESVHIRTRVPPGLVVKGKPSTDFDKVLGETHFKKTLQASESEVYAYLGAFESDQILAKMETEVQRRAHETLVYTDCFGMKSVQFATPYRTKTRQGSASPAANVSATLPRMEKYPDLCIVTKTGLPLTMVVLILLFWALVGFEYAARLLGVLGLNAFLVLLTGLLVVVVATAIATIDKPVLRIPVSLHTALAVTVFFCCLAIGASGV